MAQIIKSASEQAALDKVAVALKCQLKVLDQQKCWVASAYLDQVISILEKELYAPSGSIM